MKISHWVLNEQKEKKKHSHTRTRKQAKWKSNKGCCVEFFVYFFPLNPRWLHHSFLFSVRNPTIEREKKKKMKFHNVIEVLSIDWYKLNISISNEHKRRKCEGGDRWKVARWIILRHVRSLFSLLKVDVKREIKQWTNKVQLEDCFWNASKQYS